MVTRTRIQTIPVGTKKCRSLDRGLLPPEANRLAALWQSPKGRPPGKMLYPAALLQTDPQLGVCRADLPHQLRLGPTSQQRGK
jgi:hypothetical protein